jgi:hypothetical protein
MPSPPPRRRKRWRFARHRNSWYLVVARRFTSGGGPGKHANRGPLTGRDGFTGKHAETPLAREPQRNEKATLPLRVNAPAAAPSLKFHVCTETPPTGVGAPSRAHFDARGVRSPQFHLQGDPAAAHRSWRGAEAHQVVAPPGRSSRERRGSMAGRAHSRKRVTPCSMKTRTPALATPGLQGV